jgi:hypothetical protein
MAKIICTERSSINKNSESTYNKLNKSINMKVIKADEVAEATQPTQAPVVDQKALAAAQEKFDNFRQLLETKKYDIYLTAEQTAFFFDTFYNNVEWKGYESYAISETFDRLSVLRNDKGELKGKTEVEITEAIFHFLKNYVSRGQESAKLFKGICDQFALPVKEVNEDRQELRDLSLELVSIEQGIPVEDLVKSLEAQAQLQNQGR